MIFETAQGPLFSEATGQGQPLILLHGNGETHAIFDKAVPLLAERFRVYAIDSRGHGQSFPVSEYHYQDMMEDLRQFIAGLGLEKPVICGFSDGGIVALLLASQHPEVPGRIIACGANTRPDGVKKLLLTVFRILGRLKPSPLLTLMLTEPHITPEQLGRIACPTLIAAGSKDLIRREHTEALAAAIPGARLRILPGEGHGSYIIGSEKIASLILDFASEQPG